MTIRILFTSLLFGALAIAEEQPAAPPKAEGGFRVFTGRNGKSLEAKVVARIDDETYALQTPEGKSISIKASGMSDSDQYKRCYSPPRPPPGARDSGYRQGL